MSDDSKRSKADKQVIQDEANAEAREGARQADIERNRAIARAQNDKLAADELQRHIDAAKRARDDAAREETAQAATHTFWQKFKDYMGL